MLDDILGGLKKPGAISLTGSLLESYRRSASSLLESLTQSGSKFVHIANLPCNGKGPMSDDLPATARGLELGRIRRPDEDEGTELHEIRIVVRHQPDKRTGCYLWVGKEGEILSPLHIDSLRDQNLLEIYLMLAEAATVGH